MSRKRDTWPDSFGGVASSLDKQFAGFLRRKRGEMTHVAFAKKIGISRSSLYRLEQGEESVTLDRLDSILSKLRCPVSEVFLTETSKG